LVTSSCRRQLGTGGFWGQQTGPNPTDRAKLGSKRHLICDGRGVPLAIQLTGANRNDSQQALAQKVGFKNADVVLYPVSRHVLLRWTLVPMKGPPVKLTHIAAMNTMMLLFADSQIYSHVPDFSWLDEKFKHQTDWRLFSKNHFHGLKLPEG
jgi:hypothetical protein